jgi:hypothetical protein
LAHVVPLVLEIALEEIVKWSSDDGETFDELPVVHAKPEETLKFLDVVRPRKLLYGLYGAVRSTDTKVTDTMTECLNSLVTDVTLLW